MEPFSFVFPSFIVAFLLFLINNPILYSIIVKTV